MLFHRVNMQPNRQTAIGPVIKACSSPVMNIIYPTAYTTCQEYSDGPSGEYAIGPLWNRFQDVIKPPQANAIEIHLEFYYEWIFVPQPV